MRFSIIFGQKKFVGWEIRNPRKSILMKINCFKWEIDRESQATDHLKLKNEQLRNFIALLATEINVLEAVFLGQISTFFNS